jgi:uncharacterized repeat protein (TIGR04052 family)
MKQLRAVLLILFIFVLGAGATLADHDVGSEGGALLNGEITIRFAARVNNNDVACGMVYDGLGLAPSTVTVRDFRFYVSNFRLITLDGEYVPLELIQDGMWQYENVALLDFEDGTAGCDESGNAPMNNRVVGVIPAGEYTGLAFDLGVPFEYNHLDQVSAPSPLNIGAMWWSWQAGYKFARLDLTANEMPFNIHLGSTGCESASGNTPPANPCNNPNRVEVQFDQFNPLRNFVVLDLARLVETANLDENTIEPPGCMSMLMDPDCPAIFDGFGLDLATGLQYEGVAPALFRVQ